MTDVTEAEMEEILKSLGRTKLAEKVRRLMDEVRRRRAGDSAKKVAPVAPGGGKAHELTLNESVGTEEK